MLNYRIICDFNSKEYNYMPAQDESYEKLNQLLWDAYPDFSNLSNDEFHSFVRDREKFLNYTTYWVLNHFDHYICLNFSIYQGSQFVLKFSTVLFKVDEESKDELKIASQRLPYNSKSSQLYYFSLHRALHQYERSEEYNKKIMIEF